MKKLLILLCFIITLTACTAAETGSVPESQAESNTVELPFTKFIRDEIQADSLEEKCVPYPTGDFIQPWLCSSWGAALWKIELMSLQKAGFEFVILQFSTGRENNKYVNFYYPSEYAADTGLSIVNCPTYNTIPALLEAAKEVGMKVYIGLGGCSDWWSGAFEDAQWCAEQAENTNLLMKEIYDLYKSDYSETLAGWYWAWEMYGTPGGYEKNWSDMININLDYMTELDSTMPCLFSTFFSSSTSVGLTQFQEFWEYIFENTRFRKGDIWAPMDGFGTLSESYTYALKERIALCYVNAIKKNENLSLWFNVENFKSGGGTADLNRYVDQLEICSKYAEGLITFSYTHYYSPIRANKKYNTDYIQYLKWLEQERGISICN